MTPRPRLFLLAAATFILAGSAALLVAKPGTVRTRSGQVYDGDVVERDNSNVVTVTVRGIPTDIARSDIQSITYGQGIDAEYKNRLSKLDPKDVRGRMTLARWAFDQQRYDLAYDAADKALAIDPNNADAANFLNLVQSQQRLERARAKAATNPAAADAPVTRPATAAVDWKLLTDADINRIRQEELRKTDTRVRFVFRNDVERRYLASNRQLTINDWRAMTPLQRAIMVLDTGDPSLRDDVIVAGEPQSIQDYRRIVQPLVQANCATAACHGGTAAGPLVLNPNGDLNEAAAYTNFYILSGYKQKIRSVGDQQSVFGGVVQRRMIDRTHPDDSLLLQYGLPLTQARLQHPDVPNFHPAYGRGPNDTKYRAVLQWISTTLAPVEPNYAIQYDPPVGQAPPATQDAATTTTRPTRRR